ncbi:MAG: glutaminyl-peptide cyclotransferase [Gammaproteobacteria bacterium]|nr:glutaminyl-peptide cyclotransferase [Gammaproteobacteria bacterium]
MQPPEVFAVPAAAAPARWRQLLAILAAVVTLLPAAAAPNLGFMVMARYPHDARAFTEGLAIHGDRLIESDGLYGRSRLVVTRLRSGQVLARRELPASVFGEGVTVAGGRIVQLSWREHRGFLWRFDLTPAGGFGFDGEGWGLTYDGHRLVMSDGSQHLRFLLPKTWRPTGSPLAVHDGPTPVLNLNELEYADGLIFANVWHEARIAVIRPGDGSVLGWIDLSTLLHEAVPVQDEATRESVANGIAFDPSSGHFFVTGKDWPWLFELAVDLRPIGVIAQRAASATPQ